MSTLTITNSLYVPPFTITETLRNENTDNCSQSILEFEVIGEVTNLPVKLEYVGTPSGASATLVKLGTGSGEFIDTATNSEFFMDLQDTDGEPAFSEINLLLTNSGTTKFRFEILSSAVARNPENFNMVALQCDEIEGNSNITTFANGELLVNGNTVGLYLSNSRNMFY